MTAATWLFFVATGILGAVVGGIVGYAKTGTWQDALAGATVGGVAGLGLGAAAGAMLAGSVVASTASVATGTTALATTVSSGGIVAGGLMIADNVSQAVNHAPQVFWSGDNLAKNAAANLASSVDGITLDMTRLGQYYEQIAANDSA
jgi:hypothetical protein